MTRKTRLKRLERLGAANKVSRTPAVSVDIADELTRDDPVRLAGFLSTCHRAGLLSTYPAPDDDSQLAQFLRDAWDAGLVASTKVHVEDCGDEHGDLVPLDRFIEGNADEQVGQRLEFGSTPGG